MENKINEFLSRVQSDQSLAGKYKSAKDLKEVSEIAGSLGFQISPADFQKHFAENLSEDDLDNISGGASPVNRTSHGGWYSGD